MPQGIGYPSGPQDLLGRLGAGPASLDVPGVPAGLPREPSQPLPEPPQGRLEQILRLAAPAAIALLAGKVGGARGVGELLQGFSAEQQNRQALDIRQQQADTFARQTELAERAQDQRAQLAQREAQQAMLQSQARQRANLLQEFRAMADVDVLAAMDDEQAERVLNGYALLADMNGLPGAQLAHAARAQLLQSRQQRQHAMMQDALPEFYKAIDRGLAPEDFTFPTQEGGLITGTEIVQKMFGGQVPREEEEQDPFEEIRTFFQNGEEITETRRDGRLVGRRTEAPAPPDPPQIRVFQLGDEIVTVQVGEGGELTPVATEDLFEIMQQLQQSGQQVDPRIEELFRGR